MYMVSLNQAAGIAREEMTSLDGITAELLNFIQLKSQRLYMHSLQVANYSVSIAAKLMLPKSEIEQIKYAALLHDVGLLVVSNTLLVKIPYLNRSEMAQYKRHAAAGGNMLESIPCCQDIVPYIRYHHEHWDGSGFPKHLRGANIPLGARVIAVADYYDRSSIRRRNFGPRQKNKPSANSSAPQASSLTRKWSRPSLKS